MTAHEVLDACRRSWVIVSRDGANIRLEAIDPVDRPITAAPCRRRAGTQDGTARPARLRNSRRPTAAGIHTPDRRGVARRIGARLPRNGTSVSAPYTTPTGAVTLTVCKKHWRVGNGSPIGYSAAQEGGPARRSHGTQGRGGHDENRNGEVHGPGPQSGLANSWRKWAKAAHGGGGVVLSRKATLGDPRLAILGKSRNWRTFF